MRLIRPHLSRAERIPQPVFHSRCKGVRKVSVAKRLADGIGEMHRALVRVRLPRIFRLVLRNPRDSMCALALMTAVAAIVANSLYLQPGRHPAPIFAIRPLPVLSSEEAGPVTQLPRRRPPASDAQKPESTQKSDPVPLPRPRAQSAPSGSRPDPSADTANPLRQLSAVQRTLNEFGYGPIRVSGTLDDNTRDGIARFERDHNLPVTGQNTPRLRHALSMATGRSLE
jgi:Putative peptidoglycan binding domain